jgi:methionyl-tRNA synthetase
MLIRHLRRDEMLPAADVRVAPVLPWDQVPDPPFSSVWAVVEPGERTRCHMHHEVEAFFIASGQGTVTAGDRRETVTAGDVVYFPPFTTHTLENDCDEELLFLTIYWQDAAAAAERLSTDERVAAPRRTLIYATPPTPNGDLHLGHLAGPYLAADVHRRYLRLRGVDARLITGSDDNQSYVASMAEQRGESGDRTCDHFAGRIEAALTALDAAPDHFQRFHGTGAPRHDVQELFRRLLASGHVEEREEPTLVCPRCDRQLFEAWVSGGCPFCGAATSGNGCEGCGIANDPVALSHPECRTCGGPPEVRPARRFVFPLEPHRDALAKRLAGASLPTNLRLLCDRAFAAGELPAPAVTHRAEWGTPVPLPGWEGHVIWSWFEMAPGYASAARALGHRLGWPADERPLTGRGDTRVVQFFGIDNGFFIAFLMTGLYLASEPRAEPPVDFVCNEFYRLDDSKFSTSRRHLLTFADLEDRFDSDAVRYFLARTRPEDEQTSFTLRDLETTARDELGAWGGWLSDLGRRLEERFGGLAPEPGSWTGAQRRFYKRLIDLVAGIAESYEAESFSTRRACMGLEALVREVRGFALAEARWSTEAGRRDEERTAMALELAAAHALAQAAWPVMPRFAERLWRCLALDGTPQEVRWEHVPGWVPPDRRVALRESLFGGRASG